MVGGWPEYMGIKKNAFIEGLANYRDFLQLHTRVTPRRAVRMFIFALVIPVSIGAVAAHHSKLQDERRRALFPERNGALSAVE